MYLYGYLESFEFSYRFLNQFVCFWTDACWDFDLDCTDTYSYIFTTLLPNSVKCYKQWFYGVMVLVPDVGWIGLNVALCLKQFVSQLWSYSKLSKPVELWNKIYWPQITEIWKIKMSQWKWKLFNRVWLFETPWTIQPMEFSRPEYWSG